MDLIYCAGSNQRLMQIAQDAGWLLGVRSDKQSYGLPIAFVDIDYKAPDWPRHMQRVMRERPKYAIVPDLRDDVIDAADIERAVHQARELARYCEIPLIVPKLPGQIRLIPADIAIAFSIPTSYGGAHYGLHELHERRVHLLGGNPRKQMTIAAYLRRNDIAEVMSADGNVAQKVAWKLNYWSNAWKKAERGTSAYECWRQSCRNIYQQWNGAKAA